MKCAFLTILICIATLQGLSQNVTISEKNISLAKMMNLIKKQTGCYFSFSSGITGEVTKVSLKVKNKPLPAALDILFSKLPYTYLLKDNFILIIDRKSNKPNIPSLLALSGTVEADNGEPIAGATISILSTQKGFTTNSNGHFSIPDFQKNTTLQISSIGYETVQIFVADQVEVNVKLKATATGLDEAIVIGYGKTSRRLNTGSVNKVKGSEIIDQPVPNFLAALAGRVPGMLISQVNGIPGAAYKAQIQGQSSIKPNIGNFPEINVLFIVDGVPYAPNNNNLPTISASVTLGEGRSSFDLINIADIESIEILKDADATAIYGSRGANGVVLITTKKGTKGKTVYNFSANTGFGRITRYPDMMNTADYVKMRRSAIANDGNTPNSTNAPDLFKWDTTKSTDFKSSMIGGTARISNAYFSIGGGNKFISYLFSNSFRRQTTVFPGNFHENTFYSHGNVEYKSTNNKLASELNFLATHDDNLSPSRDMTVYVNLPPNSPNFYDSTGELVWQQGGLAYNNPMATLIQPYRGVTTNILLNFNSSYKITNKLAFKINAGINNIASKESILQPRKSFNTFSNPNAIATSYFGNTKLKSWILEPLAEYNSLVGKGKISVIMGSTYQQLNSRITNHTAYFPNDSFLNNINAATIVKTTPNNSVYKYVGVFGRVGFNWLDKYIINFTGRRDGSSRFGEGKQFGNFGAFGAAWIFSKEPFITKAMPFLSFGKFRTSYGVTGSDQIGDYQYLDQWIQTTDTYQGISGITPISPANPYYSWEENKKLSIGTELGFLNDRVLLSTNYYRNRTGNQIITVLLPSITGFERLFAANYPAVLQNSGWEFTLHLNSIKKKDYSLSSMFILTVPKNKLLSFPNFSISQYINQGLYIGKSISSISGLTYSGVDRNTGLYTFKDFDNDGTLSYPNDYSVVVNQDPKYYGSLLNKFRYKNFQLECLIEFKKQISYNYLHAIYQNRPPGGRFNLPVTMSNYWQKTGDETQTQKLTASANSEAYNAAQNFLSSNAVFSNADYFKIKYTALAYHLSENVLRKLHLTVCRVYISSNNLVIFTPFKATDTETVKTFTLPPLRTVCAGIQMSF
jgi:TonB-dependent starch-binding outer membrane protein SusC